MIVGPRPSRALRRLPVKAPTGPRGCPIPKTIADLRGRQPELADGVHDVGREGDVAEQVGRAGAGRDAAQVRGCPGRSAGPSATSVRRPSRAWPCSSTWRSGVGSVPPDEEHEERRHDVADARRAGSRSGPSAAPIRPPPRAGPAVWAIVRVTSSLELPSMSWSRSTSDGRYDWYATSKKTVRIPATKPDDVQLRRWSGRRTRRRSGSRPGATARPRSPTMRMGRRRRRSTQAPAGRLNRMNGRNSIVPSSATSKGVASRSVDRDERDGEQADLRAELADRLGRPQLQEVGVAERGSGGLGHRGSLAAVAPVGRGDTSDRCATGRPRAASDD